MKKGARGICFCRPPPNPPRPKHPPALHHPARRPFFKEAHSPRSLERLRHDPH
ncbi:hypothetical protein [Lysobacter gummosus]|uniref:hypothetical protein n=1 Tax=Lysobacter gummosus TaxID=262324 RepID=UPI00362F113E